MTSAHSDTEKYEIYCPGSIPAAAKNISMQKSGRSPIESRSQNPDERPGSGSPRPGSDGFYTVLQPQESRAVLHVESPLIAHMPRHTARAL